MILNLRLFVLEDLHMEHLKAMIFYLADFGYSKKYVNYISYKNKSDLDKNLVLLHYEDKLENKFQGTDKFMPIEVSKGFRPSRKSDIESLIYTIFFFINKEHPWDNIKSKNHEVQCRKICLIKEKIIQNNLFENNFPELIYIYIYKCKKIGIFRKT